MNEFEPKIKSASGNAIQEDFKLVKNLEKVSMGSDIPADRVSLSSNIKNASLSKEPKNGSGEIRHHLVNKFKNILSEGTYSIKADEIADKLVQNIRDNKNHLMF